MDATQTWTVPPAPPARRVVVRAVLGVVAVVALLGCWVGLRAWQAADALAAARAQLDAVDLDASVATVGDELTELRHATSRAASAASDPVWRAAEVLPWAGDHLEAVRVVATSLDSVVAEAVPAAADLERLLDDGLRLPDGRYDVAALRTVADRAGSAAAAVSAAHAALAALDPDALVGPLADPVRQAQQVVARVDADLAPAARMAGALPAMLGGDGPRTYLVLALNTAELRAAGGIVGTVVAVRVDDGALVVVDRRSTEDLRPLDEPVLPLTPEELATWGDRLGRWVQNAVLTPSFPRSAELVAARWTSSVGGVVDGVMATDPVAVAGLVGATGPVPDADGGQLEADGLVDALLRDAYREHPDPEAADEYFGQVAENLVAAVARGAGEPQELLRAGRRATDERRLRLWSAHPDEQERIAGTAMGGAFTSALFADQPGIFLDDTTQGKLGAYLTTAVELRDARCTGPRPSVRAVLRLEHRPPAGIETWSPYVTGFPDVPVPPGTLLTTVSVWSTQDGPPLVVTRDGAPVTGTATRVQGRSVLQVASRLAPGQTQEIAVDVPLQDGAVTLWTTPTLTSPGAVTHRCG